MVVLPLLSALALAIFIAIVTVTELVAPIERPSLSAKIRGVGFSLVNVAASIILAAAFERLWRELGIRALMNIEVAGWIGIPAAIMASLLFSDFLNYWSHRAHHRFFWRIHRLHHCQTELCAATSYAHFTERCLRDMIFVVPLSLVMLDFPAVPFVLVAVRETLELYIHSPTELHLGALRWVIVDNRFHRIHHSTEPRHFDRNFGILFSFWDRLFGTAHEPTGTEWPAAGVAGIIPPRSLGEYVLFPFAPSADREQNHSLSRGCRDEEHALTPRQVPRLGLVEPERIEATMPQHEHEVARSNKEPIVLGQ